MINPAVYLACDNSLNIQNIVLKSIITKLFMKETFTEFYQLSHTHTHHTPQRSQEAKGSQKNGDLRDNEIY